MLHLAELLRIGILHLCCFHNELHPIRLHRMLFLYRHALLQYILILLGDLLSPLDFLEGTYKLLVLLFSSAFELFL